MGDDILKKIDKRLKRLEDAVFGRKGKIKQSSQTKKSDFSGTTGGVRFLISKGYFKKKQGLAEVRIALSENGYYYSK